MIKSRKDLQLSYDEEWDAYEVDEETLLDELELLSGGSAPEPRSSDETTGTEQEGEGEGGGGMLLDWHTNEIWPERWVDLVVVLRTSNRILWERLEKR